MQKQQKNLAFVDRLKKKKITPADQALYIDPIFSGFAYMTDPTAIRNGNQWKYLHWICQTQIEAPAQAEDLYKTRDDLNDFHAFKDLLPIEARTIDAYKDRDTLQARLRPHQQKRDEKKARKLKTAHHVMAESTTVYHGPAGRIVIPHTKEASIHWGRQTSWCVAATKSQNYFDHYNKTAPLFIYLPTATEEDKKEYPDFASFKFAGTQNQLFNELDKNPEYIPPFLKRLLDEAESSLPPGQAGYLKRFGAYKHYGLIPPSPPDTETEKEKHILGLSEKDMYAAIEKEPGLLQNHEFLFQILKRESEIIDGSNYDPMDDYVSVGWDPDMDTIQAVAKYGLVLKHIDPSLYEDKDFMMKAMKHYSLAIHYASPELRANPDFMLKAIQHDHRALYFTSDALRADRNFVDKAITIKGRALRFATDELRTDKKLALKALENARGSSPALTKFLSRELQADEEVILAQIKRDPSIVGTGYLDSALFSDLDFMLKAVRKSAHAFRYASDNLKKNKKLALEALKSDENGYYNPLDYANHTLYADEKFMRQAVEISPIALSFTPPASKLRADKQLVLKLVEKNPYMLKTAADSLKADKEVVLKAIESDAAAIQYASGNLKADQEIVLAAIKHDIYNLKNAAPELHADPALMSQCLKQDIKALRYADNSLYSDRTFMQNLLTLARDKDQKTQDMVLSQLHRSPLFFGTALTTSIDDALLTLNNSNQTKRKPTRALAMT